MMNDETIKEVESIVHRLTSDSNAKADVEDERDSREPIGLLSTKASQNQIINKINEIINEFNKTLISNRI